MSSPPTDTSQTSPPTLSSHLALQLPPHLDHPRHRLHHLSKTTQPLPPRLPKPHNPIHAPPHNPPHNRRTTHLPRARDENALLRALLRRDPRPRENPRRCRSAGEVGRSGLKWGERAAVDGFERHHGWVWGSVVEAFGRRGGDAWSGEHAEILDTGGDEDDADVERARQRTTGQEDNGRRDGVKQLLLGTTSIYIWVSKQARHQPRIQRHRASSLCCSQAFQSFSLSM